MASIDLIPGFESFSVNEAKLSKIHNAAKKGSYPVTLVVIENGKVVKQELVGTPQIVPAAFNQLKKEYPKATVHVESKTGERLFSESVVTEDNDTIDNLNSMANTDLERIGDYADMIKDRMSQGQQLDAWMYSKISDSVKNLNSVHDTMDGKDGIDEAEKHEFNPNETAERLKRREQQNIERFRAAQDREDPFAVQYYQLRISLDKMDLQRLKIQTQIHQLKQKYKK